MSTLRSTCSWCPSGSVAAAVVWPNRAALEAHALTHRPEDRVDYFYGSARGNAPGDVTDVVPGQEFWAEANQPAVNGLLEQPFSTPKQAYPIVTINGRQMKNIPWIPFRISSKIEGWRLEAWFRLDSNLTWVDLKDRIFPTSKRCDQNFFGMKTKRYREFMNAIAWTLRSPDVTEPEAIAVSQLTQHQIDYNTSWDILANGIFA